MRPVMISRFTTDGLQDGAPRFALHLSALERQPLIATETGMLTRGLPFSMTAEDGQGRWDGSPDRRYDASGRNGIYAGTPGRECEVT